MRISTAWAQQLSVDAMNSQQTSLAKLNQQMSSGLKVSSPADDPAAAVKILDLNGTISKTNQYQSNIATARGRLSIEESALTTSGNILTRVKELTVQAMNATLNSSDRLSVKTEVDQLTQELVGIANTQNANGEYIFSGDLATSPSFVQNSVTGEYVYQGGPQQRALQISPTRQVADGDLGVNVFENIKSSSPAADQNGNRSIFNTLKSLSDALNSTFNATPASIMGTRFLKYGVDYTNSQSPTRFDLVSNVEALPATVPPTFVSHTSTIDLSGKKLDSVDAIATEINKQLAATSLPGPAAIQARSNGNSIEFVSVAIGGGSSITINNTSGTFLTDAGLSNGQTNTGADEQDFQSQLGDVLTDLDTALGGFLQATTSVGVRQNALDSQESQNGKFILDTQTTLSQTQDLDYADAISKFQLQTTALQAAQQAFIKIKGLSLFNYL
ncbi:MAG: flagellar hook-associated protein FlgL [Methylobacter sp.]